MNLSELKGPKLLIVDQSKKNSVGVVTQLKICEQESTQTGAGSKANENLFYQQTMPYETNDVSID
jgi:hypothetical protein